MATLVSPSSRSRIRGQYHRWFNRWGTPACDSFNRLNRDGIGSADTGHDWTEFQDAVQTDAFRLISGQLGPISSGAGVDSWAFVNTGLSDVRVGVVLTTGTFAGTPALGIAFRLSSAGVGLFFGQQGVATSCKLMNFSSGIGASITTAAFNWANSTKYFLEVTAVGQNLTCKIDGVTYISTTSATGQTNTRHGFSVLAQTGLRFDSFRCLRAA